MAMQSKVDIAILRALKVNYTLETTGVKGDINDYNVNGKPFDH